MTASTARRSSTSFRTRRYSASSTAVCDGACCRRSGRPSRPPGLKREGYRIAGYEARAGGYLDPHRDNSSPTNANRRFTMTVNLNAGDYDGGELRFREYGEQLYAVERGTAIVWSASLLHEVLPVTKGRRLVLGVHMFAGNLTAQAPVERLQLVPDRGFDQRSIGGRNDLRIGAQTQRFGLYLPAHQRCGLRRAPGRGSA